jgi:hypothetical protein
MMSISEMKAQLGDQLVGAIDFYWEAGGGEAPLAADEAAVAALGEIADTIDDLDESLAARFLKITPEDRIEASLAEAILRVDGEDGPKTANDLMKLAVQLRGRLPALTREALAQLKVRIIGFDEPAVAATKEALRTIGPKIEERFGEWLNYAPVAAEDIERFLTDTLSAERKPQLFVHWDDEARLFDVTIPAADRAAA